MLYFAQPDPFFETQLKMNWKTKAHIQRTLSALPGGMVVNDLLQRVGSYRNPDAAVDRTVVKDWLVQAQYFTEIGRSICGLRMVEIGTGWMPVFPVCYALAGAETCITYDLYNHLSQARTMRMLERLHVHIPAIAKVSASSIADVQARYEHFMRSRTLSDLLTAAGITYRPNSDVSRTGLPDRSIDTIYSNNVLEHVETGALRAIMGESARILKTGGIAVHDVNCGDHFAYSDASISQLHYLQYSSTEWKRWNNSILYQNRLRPSDFIRVAEKAGFEVVLRKSRPHPELLEQIPAIAPEFSRYGQDDLSSTSLALVVTPACPNTADQLR